jgi:hypothetical protein
MKSDRVVVLKGAHDPFPLSSPSGISLLVVTDEAVISLSLSLSVSN